MPEIITQIINSLIQIVNLQLISVVLSLLFIFQWYKQQAKEQSIKNNLFSIRRMVDRASRVDSSLAIAQKSADLIDVIDSTLATLDARNPFKERLLEVLHMIQIRFRKESLKDLERLPDEGTSVREEIRKVKIRKLFKKK